MKKKAEDLKPGDIINYDCGSMVVVAIIQKRVSALVEVDALIVELNLGKKAKIEAMTISGINEVESPALSPAQQHAGDFLMMMIRAVNILDGHGVAPEFTQEARALLARIDPPKPPSVEELAEALGELRHVGAMPASEQKCAMQRIDSVLDRARAAGQLKGGQQ